MAVDNRIERNTTETIMAGVVAMLVVSVLQRVVGLARNLGFSLLLSVDQLGLWSLANSIFIIAPPLVALGLPGSLGKFVEHHRQRGNLRVFVQRIAWLSFIGPVVLALIMVAQPKATSVWLYGQEQVFSIVVWTVITLAVLCFHNFVYDLVLSLRLVRLASTMQFVNSAAFCLVGVWALYIFKTWSVLLPSYALACFLASLPGMYGIWSKREDFKATQPLPQGTMWQRVFPFAVALWLINFLTNAFDLCDRYMLLHLNHLGAEAGQALVGQFYCARILPNLLVSLGLMFSGIVLPYLSLDWEQRQHGKIVMTMNNLIVVLGLLFTSISIGALAASPLLFDWVLGERFNQAYGILPLGLMQATWAGMAMLAANYLLVSEKGRQYALVLAGALAINVALNWPLIQWMGLSGAAWATAASNACLFLMICWRLQRAGCPIQAKSLVVGSLPLSLLLGPHAAGVLFLLLAIVCGRTNWLLNNDDRQAIDGCVLPRLRKVGLPIETLWRRQPTCELTTS
jgi:PST family polysaccharide transporter